MSEQHLDMLGNPIQVGDKVVYIDSGTQFFCQSVVTKLTKTRCYFENYATFAYGDAFRTYDKVFSLSALKCNAIFGYHTTCGEGPLDALGNQLSLGDKVLYISTGEHKWDAGFVNKLSDQTCTVGFEYNPGDVKYSTRRYYSDVISLTAIHKTDFSPFRPSDD